MNLTFVLMKDRKKKRTIMVYDDGRYYLGTILFRSELQGYVWNQFGCMTLDADALHQVANECTKYTKKWRDQCSRKKRRT